MFAVHVVHSPVATLTYMARLFTRRDAGFSALLYHPTSLCNMHTATPTTASAAAYRPDLERKVSPDADVESVSSQATPIDRLSSRHPTLHTILTAASLVPLSSAFALLLMLIGHLLVLGLWPRDSFQAVNIRTIPIAASVASGAVGGAVWAGAALAFLGLLRLVLGPDMGDIVGYAARILACASIFAAPPIGIDIMRGVFHGHVLSPVFAVGISTLASVVLGLTTLLVVTLTACATNICV